MAMALMIKEGRGSEMFEQISLRNSPVPGTNQSRFDYYQDAFSAAFAQLERHLKEICDQ